MKLDVLTVKLPTDAYCNMNRTKAELTRRISGITAEVAAAICDEMGVDQMTSDELATEVGNLFSDRPETCISGSGSETILIGTYYGAGPGIRALQVSGACDTAIGN